MEQTKKARKKNDKLKFCTALLLIKQLACNQKNTRMRGQTAPYIGLSPLFPFLSSRKTIY